MKSRNKSARYAFGFGALLLVLNPGIIFFLANFATRFVSCVERTRYGWSGCEAYQLEIVSKRGLIIVSILTLLVIRWGVLGISNWKQDHSKGGLALSIVGIILGLAGIALAIYFAFWILFFSSAW